jgi:exopolyphosphatase/guanosine-5'-triphosphate,3'-diphosphate pyrophosphatase
LHSYNKQDLDLIASVARYHRKAHPSQKHLAFSQLSPNNQDVVRKLSAILRIADAFDYKHEQRVKSLTCTFKKSKSLTITGASSVGINDEIEWALNKGELLQEVFNLDVSIQRAKNHRSR